MNFDRFSQLWDALVTYRPKPDDAVPITNGMSDATAIALIEYSNGDKSKINAIRIKLGRAAIQ